MLNFMKIGLLFGLMAFIISTIILGVQKSRLANDLDDAKLYIEMLEEMLDNKVTTTVAATTTTTTTTTEQSSSNIEIDYRLPKSLKPVNYNLHLHPNIDDGHFNGTIIITIDCIEKTNQIVLHSLNLTIDSIELINLKGDNVSIQHYDFDLVREFLIITLNKNIEAGKQFELRLVFNGSMLNKIVGLYSSSYVKANGSKRWIATSKFEPTYARQAFPCFDEPALKATFRVTLTHPVDEKHYHALSNMNIVDERPHGLYNDVVFNISVPMSTYLACFIVSDFEFKSVRINTNDIGETFVMRAFATPEQIHKIQFALKVGKQIIEYYINYFEIEYPLPKLDMVAIPDFVSGAMEHWGLVTYRETSLLYDKNSSSTINKQRVAAVIAHEFAHMWFGNLVTMEWWNDLWLNEGFAKYIEHKGVDTAFPSWKMQDQFITNTLHEVLALDATLASHPIIQPVRNPDEITEIFDSITYSKSAAIIRMLEDFLDAEKFRRAVQTYLNNFKYGNAVTNDFLNEINNLKLNYDVKPIMRTWLEQMGLPVINVIKLKDGSFKLTQKRFLTNPDDYEHISYNDSPFNYKWSIPITYKSSDKETVQRDWFYYNQDELIINISNSVSWIKFNCDQVGYYRVNYEDDLWQILADNLKRNHMIFSVGDRASLLNDAFALADATQITYALALDMTIYLQNEYDYVPWNVAAVKIASLKKALLYTDIIGDYTSYTLKLIRPIFNYVYGFNITIDDHDDDHLKRLLRVVILNAACSLGLEECLMVASEKFNAWLENPHDQLHPDIREIVYYFGMLRNGNEINWHKMWQVFINEQDANEKSKLMKGLAATQDPSVLYRYVQLAWNDSFVRGQDYFNCLAHIAANPIGESIVWDYVREYWLKLTDRFSLNDRTLGNLIPSITQRFNTYIKLEEMQQFFDKYPQAGAGSAARVRALNKVKNNIAWLDNNLMVLRDWLKSNHNSKNTPFPVEFERQK